MHIIMNQIPMIRILLLYSMRNLVQISKNYSDYTFSTCLLYVDGHPQSSEQ